MGWLVGTAGVSVLGAAGCVGFAELLLLDCWAAGFGSEAAFDGCDEEGPEVGVGFLSGTFLWVGLMRILLEWLGVFVIVAG